MTRFVTTVFLCSTALLTGAQDDSSEVAIARRARDHADVETLRKTIDAARGPAGQKNNPASFERLALYNLWLCEAGHAQDNNKLIKQAAEDGLAAAEAAVALNPNSSEAHRLLGDLLGELIPRVFAGGARYGRRSVSELEKAIELDPRNANACIARAVSYFYTPAMFGGSREKAVDMLKKAVGIDPSSDSTRIWLAQVYLAAGQRDDALREVKEALRQIGRAHV